MFLDGGQPRADCDLRPPRSLLSRVFFNRRALSLSNLPHPGKPSAMNPKAGSPPCDLNHILKSLSLLQMDVSSDNSEEGPERSRKAAVDKRPTPGFREVQS